MVELLRLAWPSVKVAAQVIGAAHLIMETTFELQPCEGFSMLPTISYTGDVILVSPIPYWAPRWLGGGRGPQRGDLVSATNPLDPNYNVCKRIVGLPGDVVEVEPRRGDEGWEARGMDEGKKTDQERKAIDLKFQHRKDGEGRFVKVPKGHVWLSGDNLSNSTDSRTYGPVPLGLVTGKVIARIWHDGWPDWTRMSSNIRELGESPAVSTQATTVLR